MKKKFVVLLVIVLGMALVVPAAMALTDNQKQELQALFEEEHQIRLRIADKLAETGQISAEEAQNMKERLNERWEKRKERLLDGDINFGRMRKSEGGPNRRGGDGVDRGLCPQCPAPQENAAGESST